MWVDELVNVFSLLVAEQLSVEADATNTRLSNVPLYTINIVISK